MMRFKMRTTRGLLLSTAIAVGLAPGAPAFAQAAVGGTDGGPPALVGRVAAIAGPVSFHRAGGEGWVSAEINEPVSDGDAVFSGADARATVEAGADLVLFDAATELDVGTLDPSGLVGSAPQGRLFLALGQGGRAGGGDQVSTPRGTVRLAAPGTYELVAGDSESATAVVVIAGSAHLEAPGLALDVGPGQTATVTGTGQLAGAVQSSVAPDPFAVASERTLAAVRAGAVPPAAREMTGCQALAGTGRWSSDASYGAVWYPPVAAGWVPYREGHWDYVSPWGWTWIDAEPWGFAPFHYGRWVLIGDQWAWVPGDAVPQDDADAPVYAPALVAWTDDSGLLLAGAAAGLLAAGAIGWVPLGPGEAYVPPYDHDRGYFDRLNRRSVRDIGRLDPGRAYAGRSFGQFADRRGATVVPAAALRSGAAIGAAARGFPPGALAAHPLAGRPLGIGRPDAGHAAAAGPALLPGAFRPRTLPGGRLPFRSVAAGAGAAAPGRAGALPAIRAHGEVLTARPGAPPETPPGLPAGVPGRGPDAHGPDARGAAIGAGALAGAGAAALAARHGAGAGPSPTFMRARPPVASGRAGEAVPRGPSQERPVGGPVHAIGRPVSPGVARFAPPSAAPRAAPEAHARPEAPRADGPRAAPAPHPAEPPRPAAPPAVHAPPAFHAPPPAGPPPRAALPRAAPPPVAPPRAAPPRAAPPRGGPPQRH